MLCPPACKTLVIAVTTQRASVSVQTIILKNPVQLCVRPHINGLAH
jgi:hypothetical protein